MELNKPCTGLCLYRENAIAGVSRTGAAETISVPDDAVFRRRCRRRGYITGRKPMKEETLC